MELRHIRYFLAVAEEKNFTRAAEKLLIAQPPLSRQIKELEEELGVTLFVRNPHKLELTSEGHVFLQYAQTILHLADQSKEAVGELSRGLYGTIYLASVEGYAPHLAAEWIAAFKKEHPNVTYNLWNGNSDDVIHRVQHGLCELGIIVEPHNSEGLNSLHVYTEAWVALIPINHPLAKNPGTEIRLKDLADYDLIIPSRESRLNEINGWLGKNNHPLRVICRVAHMLNAIELTKAGIGIAIYPASTNIIEDPAICVKTLIQPSVNASYSLICNKNRELSHVAGEFWNFICEHTNKVEVDNF